MIELLLVVGGYALARVIDRVRRVRDHEPRDTLLLGAGERVTALEVSGAVWSDPTAGMFAPAAGGESVDENHAPRRRPAPRSLPAPTAMPGPGERRSR